MLIASPHPNARRPLERPVLHAVVEGADCPRGLALSRLLRDHPQANATLELTRSGDALDGWREDRGAEDAELVFLCTPGERAVRRARTWLAAGVRVLDLTGAGRLLEARLGSHDPRLVYGVPELSPRLLRDATLVVAPGPLVTGATLALAPAAQAGFLAGSVELVLEHPQPAALERAVGGEEVEFQLARLSRGPSPLRVFINPRTCQQPGLRLRALLDDCGLPSERIHTIYKTYYAEAGDVEVLPPGERLPHGKLGADGRVLLTVAGEGAEVEIGCALDTEQRSAPRQALRCMNLMFGLPAELGASAR